MLLRLELSWELAAPIGKTNLLAVSLLTATLLTYPLATVTANILTTNSALALVRWSHAAVAGCGVALTVLPTVAWTRGVYFLCSLGLLLLYTVQNAALICWGQRTLQCESIRAFAATWELQVQLSAVAGSLASVLLSGMGLSRHGPWSAAVVAGLSVLLLNGVPDDRPTERDGHLPENDSVARPHARPSYRFIAIMLIAMMPYITVLIGNFLWPAVLQSTLADESVYKFQAAAFALGAALAAATRRFVGSTLPMALLATNFLVFAIAISTVAIAAHFHLTGLFISAFLFVGASSSVVKICRNEILLRETSVAEGIFVGKFSTQVGAVLRFGALLLGATVPALVVQWMPMTLAIVLLLTSLVLIGLLLQQSRLRNSESYHEDKCLVHRQQ